MKPGVIEIVVDLCNGISSEIVDKLAINGEEILGGREEVDGD